MPTPSQQTPEAISAPCAVAHRYLADDVIVPLRRDLDVDGWWLVGVGNLIKAMVRGGRGQTDMPHTWGTFHRSCVARRFVRAIAFIPKFPSKTLTPRLTVSSREFRLEVWLCLDPVAISIQKCFRRGALTRREECLRILWREPLRQ